jgi:hypothetical protein
MVVAPSIEILPPEDNLRNVTKPLSESGVHLRRSTTNFMLSLVGAAILVIIAYLVVERGLHDDAPSTISASLNTVDAGQPVAARTSTTEFAIPSSYGVYALSAGHLIELRPLSIKVPNRLMPISITIESTSVAKLANGRTQFVVFRRDMANNAPEKVHVRRVAQIARASREPDAVPDGGDTWTITDTTYEMKVSPLEGNPAMILIRPAAPNFAFPVGRYALVLGSTAYDFSVEAY